MSPRATTSQKPIAQRQPSCRIEHLQRRRPHLLEVTIGYVVLLMTTLTEHQAFSSTLPRYSQAAELIEFLAHSTPVEVAVGAYPDDNSHRASSF